MPDTIRQRIVTNVCETLRESSLGLVVEDAEPWDYLRAPLPHAWVIEGFEEQAVEDTSRITSRLTLIVQIAFRFNSADPQQTMYRLGRQYLAALEELLLSDLGRGGAAFLTLPTSNALGRVEGTDASSIGVLTTEWQVSYKRRLTDPTAN